jgi:hypothetical protein
LGHPGRQRGYVFLERRDIDLDLRPGVDARLGNVASRKQLTQVLNDDHWPTTVEALPRGEQIQRRSKMIAERHDQFLYPTFYRLLREDTPAGSEMSRSQRVGRLSTRRALNLTMIEAVAHRSRVGEQPRKLWLS